MHHPLNPACNTLQAAHLSRVPPSPWGAWNTEPAASEGEPVAELDPCSDHALLLSTASMDNAAGRGVRTYSMDPLDLRRTNSVPEPDTPLRRCKPSRSPTFLLAFLFFSPHQIRLYRID